jgi:hypothetical protein
VNTYRLALILAGVFAVAVIAFAAIMAHRAIVPSSLFAAMLLGTYGAGLGLGRLALGKGN